MTITQTAATAVLEEVPWWATLILVPILGVLLEALRRLLKVDVTRTPDSPTLSPPTPPPAGPPTQPASSTAPIAGPEWAMIETMVGRLQAAHDELAVANRELTTKAAQQEARIEAQQATIDELRALLYGRRPPFPLPPPPPGYGP